MTLLLTDLALFQSTDTVPDRPRPVSIYWHCSWQTSPCFNLLTLPLTYLALFQSTDTAPDIPRPVSIYWHCSTTSALLPTSSCWPSGKASTSRGADLGFDSHFCVGSFTGYTPVTSQEEQMLKQSIFVLDPLLGQWLNKKSKCSNDPFLPYLQDFFTVIFLTWSTITNIWVGSCNFTTQWLHNFYFSCSPVTLSEHQGHSNWNQTSVQTCLASYQVWNKSVHKWPHTWWY